MVWEGLWVEYSLYLSALDWQGIVGGKRVEQSISICFRMGP